MKNSNENPHKTWVEVNRQNLIANANLIAKAASPLKVMAVVKADAYGLGDFPITEILSKTNIDCFGVTETSAGIRIKKHGKPVYILGGITDDEIPCIVKEGFIATLDNLNEARAFSAEAVKQGKNIECHIKIDTGMGRLGLLPEESLEVIQEIKKLPGLNLRGICSHFADADEDKDYSLRQLHTFKSVLSELKTYEIHFSSIHIANSDGVKHIAEAIKDPFTMVRVGISLYGPKSLTEADKLPLIPAVEIKSRLVAVRDLPAGASVGYKRTYKLPQPTRVGTVAIGYSNGLPMGIKEKGFFIINGKRCQVIGRVSMNLATVSLESAKEAKPGDIVTCIGEGIWIDEWANYKQTIAYDILCSLSGVEKRYL
jgi:alanine racemase